MIVYYSWSYSMIVSLEYKNPSITKPKSLAINMVDTRRLKIPKWSFTIHLIYVSVLCNMVWILNIKTDLDPRNYMSQLMRLWYLSHRRTAKAQADAQSRQSLHCSHT